MDITKEKKSLKNKSKSAPEIKNLAELFKRYPIDHYSFRKYKNTRRIGEFILIIIVAGVAIFLAIMFAKAVFP